MKVDISKKEALVNILGFIVLFILIAILAIPFYLIIRFPNSAEHFVTFSKIFIPWIIIFFLLLVFNEGIKLIFSNFASLIKRIRKGGIGPVTYEISQDENIPGKGAMAKEEVDSMIKEKDETIKFWFYKTITLTIYRSQIELLQYLSNAKWAMPHK